MEQSPVNDLDNAKQPKSTLGVMFRGACMGLAELVPGISGGTIAFVTGIYAELVGNWHALGQPQSCSWLNRRHFGSNITWVFCSALVSVWVWASLCWRQACVSVGQCSATAVGVLFRLDMGLGNLHWSRS